MVEIAVLVGLGVAALVALVVVVKVLKAALRMAVASAILVGLIVLGATWGRPYLVNAWDRMTSSRSRSTPTTSSTLSKALKNQKKKGTVLQQIDAELDSQSAKPDPDNWRFERKRRRRPIRRVTRIIQ